MGILPILLLAALALAAGFVAAFTWAVRTGQFDDLDARGREALLDLPPRAPRDD
jgi:cbb3-type cytochrome oxidase maturation protein